MLGEAVLLELAGGGFVGGDFFGLEIGGEAEDFFVDAWVAVAAEQLGLEPGHDLDGGLDELIASGDAIGLSHGRCLLFGEANAAVWGLPRSLGDGFP
ncbi:MAG: hypothetical protein HC897_18670 [Thermoanaerobaculia bacterium]|nr:hypothetical protein [Thermoanaerobaculia bacterium]